MTIKYGSKGSEVELLQLALTRGGFYSGGVDGIFGARTQNSVRRFQSDFGLAPDGIVGPITWKTLNPFLTGSFTTKIRSGDTFYRLAKRYDTTAEAIAAANPTLDPEDLRIGDTITVPYGFDLVPVNMRYTPRLVELIIDGLAARYPFIKTESYGSSEMGHALKYISFGNGTAEVLFNASHHSNEWITTPLVLKFTESILKAYVNGTTLLGRSAAELLQRVRLFVAPLVNPDGVALVNGAIDLDSAYYQQAARIASRYPSVRFPEGWKANISGTDLNLNYPAGWEEAKRVKYAQGWTSPAPRDFVGDAPLSAPESRALHALSVERDFRITLSYHTQGEVIYWKYLDIEPPQGEEIGEAMASVSGYLLDDVPVESGNAGYKDWFINTYRRPGYTIEAGRGANPLPLSEFGDIWTDNLGIMLTALERADKIQ